MNSIPPGGATLFRYSAADESGRVKSGRLRAASVADAERVLVDRGLYPVSVEVGRELTWRRSVPTQDLAIFFASVGSLVRAGLPVERAMAASEPLVSDRLATAVSDVRRRVREGESVSDALAAQSDTFPRVVIGMVRSGERGSRLGDALEQIGRQLEEEAQLRSSIRSALAYPVLILAVGIASMLIMGLVVVPRFADVLSGMGAELPRSTRTLMSLSVGLKRFGLLGLIGLTGMYALFAAWARQPDARARVDAALLRVPLLGGIRLGFASARVCRALGAMLSSGMPMLAALDAVREATGDAEVGRRIGLAREAVARGGTLVASLEEREALSPLALQLVGVGEATGELGPLAIRAGDVSADRAQRALRAAVGLLEPALVIGLGVMVALIAASLLQAVYSVRPTG
jgi:type II secretory pathway component PulF